MSKNQIKTRAFTKNEVKRIETYMRGIGTKTSIRDIAIFRTAISSLLRVKDLLSLKTDQVVFNEEVRKQFSVKQMKTGKKVEIELDETTIKALEDYLNSKPEQTEYLFTGRQSKSSGKPITDILWRKALKKYCKNVGIDTIGISTHSTRKTIATILGNQGKVRAVQTLLNHSSLAHTMKYICLDEREAFEVKREVDF
jgi:integrase